MQIIQQDLNRSSSNSKDPDINYKKSNNHKKRNDPTYKWAKYLNVHDTKDIQLAKKYVKYTQHHELFWHCKFKRKYQLEWPKLKTYTGMYTKTVRECS